MFYAVWKYQVFEGVSLAIVFIAIVLLVLALAVIACVMNGCSCKWTSKSQETLHSFLGLFFPNLINKKLYIRRAGNSSFSTVDHEQNSTDQPIGSQLLTEEVYLFGDLELVNDKNNIDGPMTFKRCLCCKMESLKCCTYFYFLLVSLLAAVWLWF